VALVGRDIMQVNGVLVDRFTATLNNG
jgi:hypothetical protein